MSDSAIAVKRAPVVLSALLALALAVAAPASAWAAPSVSVTGAKSGKVAVLQGKKASLGVKAAKGAKVTYKSSNKKVATVSKSGMVKGKRPGKAVITVTAKKSGKKAVKKVRVTVKKYVKVKKLSAYTKEMELTLGWEGRDVWKMGVTAAPSNATYGSAKDMSFKSSDPSVASVSASGMVRAKKAGKAVITATSKDNRKAKVKVAVTVKAAGSAASGSDAQASGSTQAQGGKRWVVDKAAYDEEVPIIEERLFMGMNSGHKVFVMNDDPDTLYLEFKKVAFDEPVPIAYDADGDPSVLLNEAYTLEGCETLKLPALWPYDKDDDGNNVGWHAFIDHAAVLGYDCDKLLNKFADTYDTEIKQSIFREQMGVILPRLKGIAAECSMVGNYGINCPAMFITGYKTVHHGEVGHWE